MRKYVDIPSLQGDFNQEVESARAPDKCTYAGTHIDGAKNFDMPRNVVVHIKFLEQVKQREEIQLISHSSCHR